jgi:antitoxin MazE
METTIVKIGNSKGLIIPKKILNSLGENKKFDLQLKNGGLLIMPMVEKKPRHNWEKQFADAIKKGYKPDEEIPYIENDFDKNEWTW